MYVYVCICAYRLCDVQWEEGRDRRNEIERCARLAEPRVRLPVGKSRDATKPSRRIVDVLLSAVPGICQDCFTGEIGGVSAGRSICSLRLITLHRGSWEIRDRWMLSALRASKFACRVGHSWSTGGQVGIIAGPPCPDCRRLENSILTPWFES